MNSSVLSSFKHEVQLSVLDLIKPNFKFIKWPSKSSDVGQPILELILIFGAILA